MKLWSGGEDGVAFRKTVLAQEIIGAAAGFLDDAQAGRDIPDIDMRFPVAVQPAIGRQSQTKCA